MRRTRHVACDSDVAPRNNIGRENQMKPGLRDTLLSISVFVGVLLALSSFDDRVKQALPAGPGDVSSIGSRVGDITGALWSAVQHQSIDHQPMVIFATV